MARSWSAAEVLELPHRQGQEDSGDEQWPDHGHQQRVVLDPAATAGHWVAKSSRMAVAVAVAETGFHIAMAPSQSGIRCGGVNTLETIPNGKATANSWPADSWLG